MNGNNVIDFDKDIIEKNGFTGTPVLYPTPNRVRNGTFKFDGINYNYNSKHGKPYEHGLVYYEKWNYERPIIEEDKISVVFFLECKKGTNMYKAFPIKHVIKLIYSLSEKGLKAEYIIENLDSKKLPYGFALHPFFSKLSGDEGTYLSLPAKKIMETTADLLPTGKLLDVNLLDNQIKTENKVKHMRFDSVFTSLEPNKSSTIRYSSMDFRIEIFAGEIFSHIVLYTPKANDFFCIENQTCSTDAHNLYEKGFNAESGLDIVEPLKMKKSYIEYNIIFNTGIK